MYSMLDGDALTAVEHLEFAEFAVDGGEELIFKIFEMILMNSTAET